MHAHKLHTVEVEHVEHCIRRSRDLLNPSVVRECEANYCLRGKRPTSEARAACSTAMGDPWTEQSPTGASGRTWWALSSFCRSMSCAVLSYSYALFSMQRRFLSQICPKIIAQPCPLIKEVWCGTGSHLSLTNGYRCRHDLPAFSWRGPQVLNRSPSKRHLACFTRNTHIKRLGSAMLSCLS